MIKVDQRQPGKSGIVVPALGVGVWSWGDKGTWGYGTSYTRADVTQAYRACLDAGLNFFDTAEIYGWGESERILGECMREDGRPVIVASKFAPLPNRFSARKLLDALDATLQRLGVSSIDLYQIHWPYTFLNKNALMDMMAKAYNAGKIRAIGVSNYNVKQMREAHTRLARYGIPLASNQVHYSLLHRRPETNGVLDACRELDVALIAYSPLQQGLLTGKYRAGQTFSITRARRLSRAYGTAALNKIEPLLKTMETIAQARGKSTAQVALNWLLAKDELIIPIPGAKNVRQAIDNAGAIGWRLSEEEFRLVDEASSGV